MSDDETDQLVATIGDVAGIRHHHIDLGMCRAAEADATVHRQPPAVAAVQVQVHADLARPAQRQEGEITVHNIHIVLLLPRSLGMRYHNWEATPPAACSVQAACGSAQCAKCRLRLAIDQLQQGLCGGLHDEAILLPVAQSGRPGTRSRAANSLWVMPSFLRTSCGSTASSKRGSSSGIFPVLDHVAADVVLGCRIHPALEFGLLLLRAANRASLHLVPRSCA